jgi:acyl-CoA reductase-like NAD-dependent aldehyde dehydrogenase
LKRVYVHEKIFEEFKAAMIKATLSLKVGEGNEPGVFLGPIQNQMQYDRVKSLFERVKEDRFDIAVGGDVPAGKGYFVNPTIVDRPPESSRLVVEEPFGMTNILTCTKRISHLFAGPIVPLLSYSTYDEAISKANDTHYGLGASVWSGSIERANELAQKIQAGTVWVNTHFELDGRVPFGGHKESGIGTEWGVSGLVSYCNSQTLFLKK